MLAPTDLDAQAAQKMANRYYKVGLVALQHQDLDGAIAAWDKVLAIDPNYKDAQLNRAQALQLKENLKKLGG
jgi:lipoprotein NlpI